jgi:hypothetical protein
MLKPSYIGLLQRYGIWFAGYDRLMYFKYELLAKIYFTVILITAIVKILTLEYKL